ncbi:MAG: ABC transporter permease [Chloroflexota bacterium]
MARELLDENTARTKRASATRTRRGAGRPSFTALLPPVIAALVAITAWETAVRVSAVPDYIVPAPSAIALALIAHPSRFASAGLQSLLEAVGGLTVGAGAAFALAVVMAHSRALERALYPLALLVKVTPVIAVAPLLIIWFGFGATPKVLIAALITFFPMLVNAVTGLRSVPASTLGVFRSLDASPVQTFWHLRVPSSLPYVVAALKISIPLSLIGAVVAEWMSGDGGIGLIILIANSDFDTASLFAAVVVLAVIAVTLTALVSFIERRVLWWHESADIS